MPHRLISWITSWAHEAGDKPAPKPLHRTIIGSPTNQPLVESLATEERREKLPKEKKLIRTNTQALIGDDK